MFTHVRDVSMLLCQYCLGLKSSAVILSRDLSAGERSASSVITAEMALVQSPEVVPS